MAGAQPLRSALSLATTVEDTSLALPSGHRQHCSGEQRVLEQVKSLQRTRSRHSSSGRTASTSLSPTSPLNDVIFESSVSNGNVFFGNGYSKTNTLEKITNRHLFNSTANATLKSNSAYTRRYEFGYTPVGWVPPNREGHRSLSLSKWREPPQRLLSNRNTYKTHLLSSSSQYASNNQHLVNRPLDISKKQSKPTALDTLTKQNKFTGKEDSGFIENSTDADITMKEAVEFLSNEDVKFQHCGASYIQHNTFIDDKAKEEVRKCNGIAPLVALLHSPNASLSQTASAALRNISFKNNDNKEEIQRCGGIASTVALLRETDSPEIQKQLTGLLWNLSSANSLKTDLLKSTLPVLMEHVILPYTTSLERGSPSGPDHEAFLHATSCLRNLSSAKQGNRQTMRKCRGLVDSLVAYLQDCVDNGRTDDKCAENCACILHNLTFELEAESPALFNRIRTLANPVGSQDSQGDTGPIGCFAPTGKGSDKKRYFDFPVVEDPNPAGAGWLIHSKTLQNYLSLLDSSHREETQEACCGALQNLTAQEGIVSNVMSQTMVQKLEGLHVITPLLKSNKVTLQRNAVALIRNFSKNPNLQGILARKVLPELLGILSAGTEAGNESDDTLAMACQTANFLLAKEPESGKRLLNGGLINSLKELSQNRYFPKSSKSASAFLYHLWSDKDIQSLLKKQGMNKSSFINDVTTAAHKSSQVID
ncbi:plakophilin-1 [Corythoichthys intestinalis]|uniref:plakophilin-1 n=1 Tax=Corythoichthys intestinalis TaxID=161448 RepID=UPI0025A54761|nr:plakophilin-1 [Corythoichthys intestinalis]XP_061814625.1 plakophilin-1-like [Nerophis lumbriciformis]